MGLGKKEENDNYEQETSFRMTPTPDENFQRRGNGVMDELWTISNVR